jgi:hypothetical protein
MHPYSEAAQTAIVFNYDDIPNCLVGPEALLPPLDISVNQFLLYQLHSLCAKPGKRDGVATIAWSLHNTVAPVNLHFLCAFLLPDPDTLHAFIMSSVPDGTKSVLVNGVGFPVTIMHTWEKWMCIHSLRAQWNKSKRWLMEASSPLGDSRHARHYNEALSLLERLSWGGPIYGFSDTGQVETSPEANQPGI